VSKSIIRLSKSVVAKEEAYALGDVILNDGILGMGKYVQKFENELCSFLGNDVSICCVNTGTAALHLAVASIVSPGDEVLVQSITYLSSFQAISATGAFPVACDIEPDSITIDLQDAEKRITDKTKAIMPVHYAGNPGDLDSIYRFSEKHNLRMIEDAAHAFGTNYKGRNIGSFGDIVCFSFDGIKNITSGEGGAIVTQDTKVLQYVKDARLLGIHKDTKQRYMGLRSWEFDVTHQGYRYHMSNLFAAIGIEQLEKFPAFRESRQKLAKRYDKKLKNLSDVLTFDFNYDNVVPHIYPVRILNEKRDGLMEFLIENNVECGIHYYPNHLLSFYAKRGNSLPVTERIYRELLTLPLHPDLSLEQQDRVVRLVKKYLEERETQ